MFTLYDMKYLFKKIICKRAGAVAYMKPWEVPSIPSFAKCVEAGGWEVQGYP